MKKKYRPLYILLLIGVLLGFVTVFLHKEYRTIRMQGDITRFVIGIQEIENLAKESRREDAMKKLYLLQEELQQVDSPPIRVTILPRLAVLYFQLGLEKEARQAFEDGSSLFQQLEIPPADRVKQLAFLSRVALLLQERELAQELLQKGESDWEKLTLNQEIGECAFYLALSFLDLNEREKVEEKTKLLKQLTEASEDPNWKDNMELCIEILEQAQQENVSEASADEPLEESAAAEE